MKLYRATTLSLTLSLLAAAPALAAELSGQVQDKQTHRPIAHAEVTVVGAARKVHTAADGTFSLGGIHPGTYPVKVEAPGYLPLVLPHVPFHDLRPVQLKASLRPGMIKASTQVVSADRPSKLAQTQVSQHTVTAEEVRKVAGAHNDPILAVVNAAGVNTGGYSGAPTVRGGGPNDNLYYLDNFQIGNPFHFGGLVSIFNADTISKVDLYLGALPARYGNVMSAVIDVETRPPKTDAIHGVFDANLLYSEGMIEGPVLPSLSFSLAGRRSYMDLLVAKAFPTFTVFPRFSDYQGRLVENLPGGGRLDLAAFGSNDSLALVLPDGKIGRGIGSVSENSGFDSQGLIYRQPIGDTASNRMTLNYQAPYIDLQIGQFLSILDHNYQWTAADDYVQQLNDSHELHAGLRYDTINFAERQTIPIIPPHTRPGDLTGDQINALPKRYVDTSGNQKIYGAYVEDAWKVNQPIGLSLGARYDRLQSTSEDHLAPRLGATWRSDPDTTWRLGYGQQFQFPSINQQLPGVGNPNLSAPFSRDYVAGVDRQIADALLGRFELYHRDLFFLVVRDPASAYINGGSGRSDGAEATVELSPWKGWSGSLALDYSRTYRTTPTDGEVPYDYDQPFIGNVLLVAPKVWGWSPSLRLRYSTGRPYTPVVGRTLKPDGTYAPVNGATNSARYPNGITWSARIERPAGLFGVSGQFYLEVTQQHEALAVDYGDNYANISNPTFNFGIPAIPYLGYQLRF